MIISLDPSLTKTGYFVGEMKAGKCTNWIEAGFLRPKAKRSGVAIDAYERLDSLYYDTCSLILGHVGVRHIAIEVTSGKTSKRHKGNGAGLALYGAAVYAVCAACADIVKRLPYEVDIYRIYENDWTRGIKKESRQRDIAYSFPQYDLEKDKGGDIADAVGLARWLSINKL